MIFKNSLKFFATIAAALLLATSCANIGRPGGGPRDEDPPRLVSSSPRQGAVDVSNHKITLTFDELINVRDAFSKVVVSPTSRSTPRVSSQGRRITVEFDSLAPNTTYTVDFADAIEDVNESNKLQGFSYTFSTGPVLDSLRISGRVLGARDLEPQQSVIVGVQPAGIDSLFTTTRLLRVAKTDDRGRFTIRGLAPGKYRVFALDDKDNDFRYSSAEENIAFSEFTVEPFSRTVTAFDSVFNPLTGRLDTVLSRQRTQFLPNDLLLRSFNSEIRPQYLSKYERTDSTRLYLKFNTRLTELPRFSVLNHPDLLLPGTPEASERLDSLVFWLSPELMRTDSLFVAVTYPRTEINGDSTVTDTLRFVTNRPAVRKQSKNDKKRRVSAADSLAAITTKWTVVSGSEQEVNRPVVLELPVPAERFDTTAVRLSVLVDTVWKPAPASLRIERPDSLRPRRYELKYPWSYGAKYRLEIDSLAATDIYGRPTLPLSHELTVRDAGEYCTLAFDVRGLDNIPAFVELLSSSDAVQAAEPVSDGHVLFTFLKPGKYYARIIVDSNGNGLYDTGNYDLQLQPEMAYYYPKAINIKKNWDKQEVWNVFDTPVDLMKPEALLKNRPATDRRNRSKKNTTTEEEEEEEIFDPNANPFDPNRKTKRTVGAY